MKRIAVFSAVIAASGLVAGSAFGLLGQETSHGGPGVDLPTPVVIGESPLLRAVQDEVAGAEQAVWDFSDRYLGIGGVHPGPIPQPTPGIHPEDYANAAIQAVAQAGSDVAQGLGSVHVGPIPAPTPGVEPDPGGRNTRTVNRAIDTGAKTVDDAALGIGGVHVGPIPQPTPGIIPVPEVRSPKAP